MAFNLEDFFKNLLSSTTSGTTPTSIQQPPILIPGAPAQILDQGFQQAKDILSKGGVLAKQPETAAPPAPPKPALTPDPETLKPFVPRITTEPKISAVDALGTLGVAPPPQRAPQVFTEAELGVPQVPSLDELQAKVPQFSLEDILKQPRIQLEQLAATLAKQKSEVDERQKIAQTREDFGRRGLFFSGMREGAEKNIQDAALAEQLNIDVKLAGILVDAFDQARKESINAAEDLLNEAKEGRKEAVAQLNKLGFAVLPNGNVVETPAEIRAERAVEFKEEQAILRNELNQAKFEYQQAKDDFSRQLALERLELATSRLELAQKGKAGPEDIELYAKDYLSGRLSLGSVPQEIRTEVSQKATELRTTFRTLTDEEIRAYIRNAQRAAVAAALPTEQVKQSVKDSIVASKKFTEADISRFLLILNEMIP